MGTDYKKIKMPSGAISYVLTNAELAKLAGKSTSRIVQLIEEGIIPLPNFRRGHSIEVHTKNGTFTRKAPALYTYKYSCLLAQVLEKKCTQGKAITPEVKQEIQKIFRDEKEEYSKK